VAGSFFSVQHGRPEGYVERNTDSCKTKFKALKTKKSTGIAEIPWALPNRKTFRKLSKAKMCAAELDDDEGDGAVIDQEQEGNGGRI